MPTQKGLAHGLDESNCLAGAVEGRVSFDLAWLDECRGTFEPVADGRRDLADALFEAGLISQVYEQVRVVSETFDEGGRTLVVRALPAAVAKLQRLLG